MPVEPIDIDDWRSAGSHDGSQPAVEQRRPPVDHCADNVLGAGRADAFAAVKATLPTWQGASTTLTLDANSTFGVALTPSQLGFTDPNSCSLTASELDRRCGTSAGTTMTCAPGTNAVNVGASNNNFAFGANVDLQVVVTDFAVDVAVGRHRGSRRQTRIRHRDAAERTVQHRGHPELRERQPSAADHLHVRSADGHAWPRRGTVDADRHDDSAHRGDDHQLGELPDAAEALHAARRRIPAWRFPGTLGFAAQTLSTTSPPQFVFLTNIGTGALAITNISSSGDFTAVSNCGTTVAVGASCGIAIPFTPSATGARTGSIAVTDDASGSPHTVSLTGTGQSAPSSTGGTPAGSYAIGVSGAVGTLSHFGNVILTVQ